MICTLMLIVYNIEEANRILEEYFRVGQTTRRWRGGNVTDSIVNLANELWDRGFYEDQHWDLIQDSYNHIIHLQENLI